LLPAATEVGDALFVVTRSAWVAVATTSLAVAVLLADLGSLVDELTVAGLLITVPAAVPAFTFNATVNVPEPAAKLGLVQVMVPVLPTAGVVQDHPAAGVIEANVVFAGVVSVSATAVAVLGPALATTCVYVMLLPACTGTGLSVLVIERSAELATATLVETVLLLGLGSVVPTSETEAVSAMMVPEAVVVGTFTTNVNMAEALAARLAVVQT
jgi:hypothetical protein